MSRKPVQQKIEFPEPLVLAYEADLSEPTIWVRRILIWHDVSKEPIRDVALSRGLNIVWSPTGNDPKHLATGHAAGKTLFCRLIRYCLGEDSFADPEDTGAIRMRFPEGAVGAEIRLRGETWAVRRRFGSHRDDRASKAESVEGLSDDEGHRDSYYTFRDAIEQTVFDADQRRLFAGMEDVKGAWQYVLAWLTRDQECRLDGLTHWRHRDSGSNPSVRNAGFGSLLNVLRIAIGLYSEASSTARRDVARAANRADATKAEARKAEASFDALSDELATALGVGAEFIWPPPVEILQDEQNAREEHLQALMELADTKIRGTSALTTDPTYALDEDQLEQTAGELARVTQQISNLTSEVERKREQASLLERRSAERWAEVREARHPVCPYDGTPLDVEEASFVCPLPHLPDPAAADRIAAETDATREKIRAELSVDEASLTKLRGVEGALEERMKALRRRIEAHQLAFAAATSASQAAWATKGMVRRLFELRKQGDDARRADEEAKDALGEIQNVHVAGLSAFSTSALEQKFDYLIRRVVAPEATGTIVLDGNGLHPRIEWRGIRRSVALNSLQIVLFDLAAMLCAVEGKSRAPAFLVHDSPREGDLDPWTYSRIFEALLELCPDERTAPFQYIVTTTTDPPEAVRSRVRLQISAGEEQHRLFQIDL
ncbi:MAG TPA: hypothetical protein VGS22_29085 [Thermoanaerobaculia bacterium]|jgi:hypothetical protein|nr:hypothetical protein [Thermoanaerobaculia bacterium]